MTDTALTYDIPMVIGPRQPKPAACISPTIQRFTVETVVRDNGFLDRWVDYWRSCGHGPVHRAWRIPWPLPVVGEVALSCLGPQVETLESGRADPTAKPLRKGKRWTRLKQERVA